MVDRCGLSQRRTTDLPSFSPCLKRSPEGPVLARQHGCQLDQIFIKFLGFASNFRKWRLFDLAVYIACQHGTFSPRKRVNGCRAEPCTEQAVISAGRSAALYMA